jgi:hypothetical protein
MLIGGVLLLASCYFFFAPLDRSLINGIIVDCGSAVRPPTDHDVLVQCAALPGQELVKGLVVGAVGLLVLLASPFVFGTWVRVDVAAATSDEPRRTAGQD